MALRRLRRIREEQDCGVAGGQSGGMHQPVEVAVELSPVPGGLTDSSVSALVGEVVAALAGDQKVREQSKGTDGDGSQKQAKGKQDGEDQKQAKGQQDGADQKQAKDKQDDEDQKQAKDKQDGGDQKQAKDKQDGGDQKQAKDKQDGGDQKQAKDKQDDEDQKQPKGNEKEDPPSWEVFANTHGRLERAAGEVIAALHQTKQELAKEMEANLKQLKAVLQETQKIAKEMEAVLQEAKAEPDPEAYTLGSGRRAQGGWNPPQYKDEPSTKKAAKGEEKPPAWTPPKA